MKGAVHRGFLATGNPPADVADAIEAAGAQAEEAHAEEELAAAGIVFQDWRDFMAEEPPAWDWIIRDVVAKGMKGDLNAKSKQWKSFFGMQLALCVSSGRPFLDMAVPRARRCAYFNLELIKRGAWERGAAMDAALKATPANGMLYVVNLRGKAGELRNHTPALVMAVRRLGIDLVVLDPRYKLVAPGEDENSAEGLRGVLDFRDALTEAAAVLMIGHDPKGDTSGKSMADRGAGSYTAGADYDFSFALTQHEQDGYTVLSTSCRYRQSPPDLTIRFDPDRQTFDAEADTPPTVRQLGRNSKVIDPKDKANSEAVKLAAFEKAVLDLVKRSELMGKGTFDIEVGKLPEAQAVGGEKRREKLITSLFERGIIAKTDKWVRDRSGKKRKLGGKNYMVGTPDKVEKYADEFNTLDL